MKNEREIKIFLDAKPTKQIEKKNEKFIDLLKTRELNSFSIGQKEEFHLHIAMLNVALQDSNKDKIKKEILAFFGMQFKNLTLVTKITIMKRNRELYPILNFDLKTYLMKRGSNIEDLEFLYYLPLSYDENKILLETVKQIYDNSDREFSLDSQFLKTWLYLAENGVKLKLKISRIHHKKMDDDLIKYNLNLFWRLCVLLKVPTEILMKLFDNYISSFLPDKDFTNDIVVSLFDNSFFNVPGNTIKTHVEYFKIWTYLYLKHYTVGTHTWDSYREFQDFDDLEHYFKNNEDSSSFTTWTNIISYFENKNFVESELNIIEDKLSYIFKANHIKKPVINWENNSCFAESFYDVTKKIFKVSDEISIFKTIYQNDQFFSSKSKQFLIGSSLLTGIDSFVFKFHDSKKGQVRYNTFIAFLFIAMLGIN